MKFVFLFFSVLVTTNNINSQGINAINDLLDSDLRHCHLLPNQRMAFLSEKIQILNTKTNLIEETIIPAKPTSGAVNALLYFENEKKEKYYVYAITQFKKITIYSFKYNTSSQLYNTVDSIDITAGAFDFVQYLFSTKAQYNNSSYYSCLSIYSYAMRGFVTQLSLLKINSHGKLSIFNNYSIENNTYQDTFLFKIYTTKYQELKFFGEDKFILADILRSKIISFDTNFNFLAHSELLYVINNTPLITNIPRFIIKENQSLLVVDQTPYGLNDTKTSILQGKIINDKVELFSFKKLINPDRVPVTNLVSTNSPGAKNFIAGNKEVGSVDIKVFGKIKFYVTLLDTAKEVWTKGYGGDYSYEIKDIELLDSCKAIITGKIYDYFNNGYIQSFYTIIDCNGNIVNSNINIKEVEPSIVYPNPVKKAIQLHADSDINRLELYDLQGKLIKLDQGHFLKGMDVSFLPEGTYFIKIFYNGIYKIERVMLIGN